MHDAALGAEKAIKILDVADPAQMKEILEAQILHKCRHENCVHINEADLYEIGGTIKLVIDMEYHPAGSLENRLIAGSIGPAEIIRHITHILYGLEHAHNQDVLHRDIKPANILLSNPSTKLSDFGLATEGVGPGTIGSAKGYRTHCAPEIFNDDITSKLTDIYAVGVTLFRLINQMADWDAVMSTLNNPQQALSKGSLIQEIGFNNFVPSKFARIVRKACKPTPDERYQNCEEFRQALERLTINLNWVRISSNHWRAEMADACHELRLLSVRKHKVEYTVNRRKRRANCKSFDSIEDAQIYMDETIAKSVFS